MFNNKTRNQHYIAQVEQKLNCIDNSVPKPKRRIYEFEILDHSHQEFKLTNQQGVKITNNLSFNDLYTLEVFEDGTRDNFESFFSELESKIETLSHKLLDSSELEQPLLLDFLCAKLMNSIRNPFCIEKTVNTFDLFCNYFPTEENLLKLFQRIDAINVNTKILSNFNINSVMYKKWLKIIFYMVVPFKSPQTVKYSFLEKIAFNFFDNEKNIISIFLSVYDDPSCLLSDRSYIALSDKENVVNYTFNVTKNAFIIFNFIPKAELLNIPLDELNIPIEVFEKLRTPIKILKYKNEESLLETYNQNVISQSYKNFYASFLYNK